MNSGSNNPTHCELFADLTILDLVKKQVSDTSKRIELAGQNAIKDPVLVLELLRSSNVKAAEEGKSPLTTVNSALVRLGKEGTLDLFGSIAAKPRPKSEDLVKHFERVRKDCTHIGGMSGVVAQVLARNLKEDAITAGTLLNIGELVAIVFLKEKYIEAASGNARAKLLYRLEKDHSFDTERVGVNFLKHAGMPEPVVSVIDRDAKPRMPARQILKPITATAYELYYAILDGKFEKYKPGVTLPLKSTLRMMQLKDREHTEIFERTADYIVTNAVAPHEE